MLSSIFGIFLLLYSLAHLISTIKAINKYGGWFISYRVVWLTVFVSGGLYFLGVL
jgi:hypothetical protein